METICLDSDLLIDFLRNKKEAVSFILEHENKSVLATTYINLFELYRGAFKGKNLDEIKKIEAFSYKIEVLNLSRAACKKAGQVLAELEGKGFPIELRDLFIGCIAQTEGFNLKTNNKKHFERIPGLKL